MSRGAYLAVWTVAALAMAEPSRTEDQVLRVPGLIVVDSLGNVVGEVVGLASVTANQNHPVVLLRSGSDRIFLRPKNVASPLDAPPDSLSTELGVYFTSSGCSGTALVEGEQVGSRLVHQLNGGIAYGTDGTRIFRARQSTPIPPGVTTYSSVGGQTCTNVSPTSLPTGVWVADSEPVVDLADLFTPPFFFE